VRTGSTAVLEGSIAALGTQYVLGLQAKDCSSGEVFDQEQAQVLTKEEVLTGLSSIASKFRTRIGESQATLAKHNTKLPDATTNSLEALKAFSTAMQMDRTGDLNARTVMQRAIAIDPNFAMAHAGLGLMYGGFGESVLSRESATRAYELRDRATDRERFFITAAYDLQVTGNLEKARQTLRLWGQTYPRDVDAHGLMGAMATQISGMFEQSIEESKKAIALDPDFSYGYMNLAFSYLSLGRLQEMQ